MAANDVSPNVVYGSDAGLYQGDSLPTAITTSSDYFIIIPVNQARVKANNQGIILIDPAKSDSDFDTATDIGHLVTSALYSYTVLNSKASPSLNLRKFDCSYFGFSIDNSSFENGKTFVTYPFNITFYRETTALSDTYDPSGNTLV